MPAFDLPTSNFVLFIIVIILSVVLVVVTHLWGTLKTENFNLKRELDDHDFRASRDIRQAFIDGKREGKHEFARSFQETTDE